MVGRGTPALFSAPRSQAPCVASASQGSSPCLAEGCPVTATLGGVGRRRQNPTWTNFAWIEKSQHREDREVGAATPAASGKAALPPARALPQGSHWGCHFPCPLPGHAPTGAEPRGQERATPLPGASSREREREESGQGSSSIIKHTSRINKDGAKAAAGPSLHPGRCPR